MTEQIVQSDEECLKVPQRIVLPSSHQHFKSTPAAFYVGIVKGGDEINISTLMIIFCLL